MQSVSKETFSFLKKLNKNNNRDWFNERKPKFKALEKEVKSFYGEVEILLNKHDDIQKTKAYRIYRDIRFSKDKTPYKTYMSAYFSRRKPQLRGGYYLHLQPGNKTFVGGGFWKPSKDDLDRVRQEWLLDAEEIKSIIRQRDFKNHWGQMRGEQLKTAPRGFDKNHPDIDLINYKQWLFHHQFTDEEVLQPDFAKTVSEYYAAIRPFFDYMTDVLNTDMNGVSILE